MAPLLASGKCELTLAFAINKYFARKLTFYIYNLDFDVLATYTNNEVCGCDVFPSRWNTIWGLHVSVIFCLFIFSLNIQNLTLNRVEIHETVDAKTAGARAVSQKKKRSYDLNPSDKFWQNHKGRYAGHTQ